MIPSPLRKRHFIPGSTRQSSPPTQSENWRTRQIFLSFQSRWTRVVTLMFTTKPVKGWQGSRWPRGIMFTDCSRISNVSGKSVFSLNPVSFHHVTLNPEWLYQFIQPREDRIECFDKFCCHIGPLFWLTTFPWQVNARMNWCFILPTNAWGVSVCRCICSLHLTSLKLQWQ